MKITYDFEFFEDGKTIEPISLGMVAEDDREFYAINRQLNESKLLKPEFEWVLENVWPQLPLIPCPKGHRCHTRGKGHLDRNDPDVRPLAQIARMAERLVLSGSESEPELWAYYAAYDHVALCQLFGRMVELPRGFPRRTNDLMQEAARLGLSSEDLPQQIAGEHNAMEDARHNMLMLRYLEDLARSKQGGLG